MGKTIVFVCSLLLQMGMLQGTVVATELFKNRKKKKATEQANTVKPLTTYEKLMKMPGRISAEGMFDLHIIGDKLYVEIPLRLMGRDMLIGSTITEISDNNVASVGEKTSAPFLVRFTRRDSTVYLNAVQDVAVAKDDENTKRALQQSFVPPILEKYEVKAYNADSSAVVIDMTDYFAGDNERMSPISTFSGYSMSRGQVTKTFQKDKSRVKKVRAFEDNVSIQSQLSYKINVTLNKQPYLKDSPFLVVMTRSILLLPEEPLRYRYADSRINVFSGGLNELSSAKGFEQKYVALRWRMEPSDEEAFRRGELVEPKKPIVFYIDNNFPENWKPAVKKAVEVWQKPFEKIGFKNAIVAKEFPKDDPNFDPDNLKYSCIRYVPSRIANAMGPSWVDPRSGEIINAAVYVYHNVVKILQSWRLVQTAQADEKMRTVDFKQEILEDCLSYVLSHEIGHCLSFMHNMSASAAIPTDSLRSPSFTRKYGTTYSIMDYARNNYVAQPGDEKRGVRLTPPELGEFDYFAVKWLYSPLLDAKTPEEEQVILRQWLEEKAGDPMFRYGAQQDMNFPLDPTSLEEDLGDNAMKASVYGIKNLKYIMKHLNEWFAKEDEDGRFRISVYSNILGQYQTYIRNVSINMGGRKKYAQYEGDKWPCYEIIPREKQIEAVKFLLAQIKDVDWLFDPEVLTFLPVAGDMKTQIQEGLFRTAYFSRLWAIPSTAAKAVAVGVPAYGFNDHVKIVSDFIWQPTRQGCSLTLVERKLQVDFLTNLVLGAGVVESMKGLPVALTGENTLFSEEFRNRYRELSGMDLNRYHFTGLCSCEHGQDAVALMSKGNGADERNVEYIPTILYTELQRVYELLKQKSGTGNKVTREHYQLLLFRLNQVLAK